MQQYIDLPFCHCIYKQSRIVMKVSMRVYRSGPPTFSIQRWNARKWCLPETYLCTFLLEDYCTYTILVVVCIKSRSFNMWSLAPAVCTYMYVNLFANLNIWASEYFLSEMSRLGIETAPRVNGSDSGIIAGLQCEKVPAFSPTLYSAKGRTNPVDFVKLNNHGIILSECNWLCVKPFKQRVTPYNIAL